MHLIQNNILLIPRYTSENAYDKENNDQSCLDDEVRKSEKNQIFDELISEATKGKHT